MISRIQDTAPLINSPQSHGDGMRNSDMVNQKRTESFRPVACQVEIAQMNLVLIASLNKIIKSLATPFIHAIYRIVTNNTVLKLSPSIHKHDNVFIHSGLSAE